MLAGTALAVTILVAYLLVSLIGSGSRSIPLPLKRVALAVLPGQDSRFDYADVDPTEHALFVAHMGDGTLLKIDTRTDRIAATASGLPSVTGVIVVPALHQVYASAAGSGEIVTLDERTLRVLARAPGGQFPDGLAYVPSTRQVWVSDENGGAETVIDAVTGRRVATVPLGGEAGNTSYDVARDRILVDVQTHDEVAVIDPRTRAVTQRVPVPGCDHDHGLLVTAGRAFVACDGNDVLVPRRLPAA